MFPTWQFADELPPFPAQPVHSAGPTQSGSRAEAMDSSLAERIPHLWRPPYPSGGDSADWVEFPDTSRAGPTGHSGTPVSSATNVGIASTVTSCDDSDGPADGTRPYILPRRSNRYQTYNRPRFRPKPQ